MKFLSLVLAFADDCACGGKCYENNQEWRKNQRDIEKSMVERGEEGKCQHGQNADADADPIQRSFFICVLFRWRRSCNSNGNFATASGNSMTDGALNSRA